MGRSMSIEVEDFPCHDLTHPPEHRAPFCTQQANPENRIEAPPGKDDLYFCDACFGVGNNILNRILEQASANGVSLEEVLDTIQGVADEGDDKPRDKN